MKGPSCRVIFLTFFLSLALAPIALSEPSSQKEVQTVEPGDIVVKSHSLEVDYHQKISIFTGEVDASSEDWTIRCEKMLVYYDNQSSKSSNKESGELGVKLDRIVATGKVRIIRPDGGLATAEEAVYYQNDEKVVLTGEPVVKMGDDFVAGSRITLYLEEERSVVEGPVKAILHPEGEKGASANGQ